MPLCALIRTDRPGAPDLRHATRPAHKADPAASNRVVRADPFAPAGIFADIRIEAWDKVTG